MKFFSVIFSLHFTRLPFALLFSIYFLRRISSCHTQEKKNNIRFVKKYKFFNIHEKVFPFEEHNGDWIRFHLTVSQYENAMTTTTQWKMGRKKMRRQPAAAMKSEWIKDEFTTSMSRVQKSRIKLYKMEPEFPLLILINLFFNVVVSRFFHY